MLRRITECLLLISAALYTGMPAAAAHAPEQYTLLGRSSMAHAEVKLDDVHRAWLQDRKRWSWEPPPRITRPSISPPADTTTKA